MKEQMGQRHHRSRIKRTTGEGVGAFMLKVAEAGDLPQYQSLRN